MPPAACPGISWEPRPGPAQNRQAMLDDPIVLPYLPAFYPVAVPQLLFHRATYLLCKPFYPHLLSFCAVSASSLAGRTAPCAAIISRGCRQRPCISYPGKQKGGPLCRVLQKQINERPACAGTPLILSVLYQLSYVPLPLPLAIPPHFPP